MSEATVLPAAATAGYIPSTATAAGMFYGAGGHLRETLLKINVLRKEEALIYSHICVDVQDVPMQGAALDLP